MPPQAKAVAKPRKPPKPTVHPRTKAFQAEYKRRQTEQYQREAQRFYETPGERRRRQYGAVKRGAHTARRAVRFPSKIAGSVTGSGPAGGLLAAELMIGAAIVLVRALGDYQLTDEGTQRGTLNTPANGGYGPFTVLAGLIASFFGLSFLAAGGGKRAKAATAFGALIVIVLMIKSMDEIQIVGGYLAVDPATRTVQAAQYSSGATQPWGLAFGVSSGASTTLGTSAGLASFGAPFTISANTPSSNAPPAAAAGQSNPPANPNILTKPAGTPGGPAPGGPGPDATGGGGGGGLTPVPQSGPGSFKNLGG